MPLFTVGRPFPQRFLRADTGTLTFASNPLARGRLHPMMLIHFEDTAAYRAAIGGEFQIFSIFRHPELFPGGLPILGFRANQRSATLFVDAPLVTEPPQIIQWGSQLDYLVGYQKHETAIFKDVKNFQEFQDTGLFKVILHNWKTDRIEVIRDVYLPLDALVALKQYWTQDINFHASSPRFYPKLQRYSSVDLVRSSRWWIYDGDDAVEATGCKL